MTVRKEETPPILSHKLHGAARHASNARTCRSGMTIADRWLRTHSTPCHRYPTREPLVRTLRFYGEAVVGRQIENPADSNVPDFIG